MDLRNILDILTENEVEVKTRLPESNPGETSQFTKNNAKFASHAEQTLDSMVNGWDIETLPEFLKDEGVELPAGEEEAEEEIEAVNEKWNSPVPRSNSSEECNVCYGDTWVIDYTRNVPIQCPKCNGTGVLSTQAEVNDEYYAESDDKGDIESKVGRSLRYTPNTKLSGYVDEALDADLADKMLRSKGSKGPKGPDREEADAEAPADDLAETSTMEEGKEWNIDGDIVNIDNGTIIINGTKVGEVNQDYKHGYHPAILLQIGDKEEWFEMDTDDLITKVVNKAVEFNNGGTATIAESDSELNDIKKLSGHVDEAIDAQTRKLDKKELVDYLDRILDKEKGKTDKYKLPYVHRSTVKNLIPIVDPDGHEYDLDKLAADITERPKKLLKQNEKMQHSDGTTSTFYNIGLPALTGLGYNEEKKEFVVINTCPGAGECKTYCYALKGGYVQWSAVSMSQTKILNFLYNDPTGFFVTLSGEIDQEKRKGDAKQDKHKVVIRWHDAGDFFSQEYLEMAYKMAATHPTVDFYAYTKMADVAGSNQNRPPNFMINFSMGARKAEERRVDFGTTKHSSVVPREMFTDLIQKDGNKLIKDAGGRIQWNNPEDWETFKDRLTAKYSIDKSTIISYSEMMDTPLGGAHADGARNFRNNLYNVVVAPGDGDDSANRSDVLGTYLLMH